MKCLILTVMFFLTASSALADDWLCTEEGSLKQGNSILACGSGTGLTEEYAREQSLITAKNEFEQICNSSSDCNGHKVVMDPKRMTCSQVLNQYKCYRLIVYTIGEKLPVLVYQSPRVDLLAMVTRPISQPTMEDSRKYIEDMTNQYRKEQGF